MPLESRTERKALHLYSSKTRRFGKAHTLNPPLLRFLQPQDRQAEAFSILGRVRMGLLGWFEGQEEGKRERDASVEQFPSLPFLV